VQSGPCTRRREAWVSWFGLKTKVDEFSGMCLKTGSSGLVIWVSKSLPQFLGLVLKIKMAMVC
jgi:hypothetical protein